MKSFAIISIGLLFYAATLPAVAAGGGEPVKRELQLIYLFDGDQPEYIFRIGQSGFRSIASLKEHLATWPAGSELTWAPGCVRLGNEPLLSSEKEMKDFRRFLSDRGIAFILIPSG